jgi:hypothetical protein
MDDPRDVAHKRQHYVDPEVQADANLQEYTNGRQKDRENDSNDVHDGSLNSNRLFSSRPFSRLFWLLAKDFIFD